MSVYQKLGIPKHKSNLFYYRDYYNLDKSYHNFIIIFDYDDTIIHLTNQYRYGSFNSYIYVKKVREHLDIYYGLRLGNSVRTMIKKALKER